MAGFKAHRVIEAVSKPKAEIEGKITRADGSVTTFRASSDDKGIRGWWFKKREEWRIWQESKEYLKANGFPYRNFLSWQLRGEDGVVHFVDVGKAWVVDKIDDSSATTMTRIAWGTGGVVPTEASTQLSTEASEARVTGTPSQQTTTITGDTYQVIGTITANGGKTITNAGLFDSATAGAGTALIIGDHAGVPVLLNDQIEYTFKLHVDQ